MKMTLLLLLVFLIFSSSLISFTTQLDLSGGLATIEEHLDNILKVRVSGTPQNSQVRDYIFSQLNSSSNSKWQVGQDEFTSSTPIGNVKFTNIWATYQRTSPKRILIACHFDSKRETRYDFYGAIDSAASCSLMLKWFKDISPVLDSQPNGYGLQMVFFDGEEAFQHWSHSDSTYGSRHLAEKWSSSSDSTEKLENIEIFVLLDLLGSADVNLRPFFRNTASSYQQLYTLEQAFRTRHKLSSHGYFARDNGHYYSPIEDDHLPFLSRGVPILHLISYPFPRVWHSVDDNREALDDTFITLFDQVFLQWLTNKVTY